MCELQEQGKQTNLGSRCAPTNTPAICETMPDAVWPSRCMLCACSMMRFKAGDVVKSLLSRDSLPPREAVGASTCLPRCCRNLPPCWLQGLHRGNGDTQQRCGTGPGFSLRLEVMTLCQIALVVLLAHSAVTWGSQTMANALPSIHLLLLHILLCALLRSLYTAIQGRPCLPESEALCFTRPLQSQSGFC